MAFESLTEKLQNVFKKLKSKGRLTEADVKEAMKEVRMALLEADVNFKVVKSFTNSVTEKAVGSDVLESLTPGQQVIKIVNEELTRLMGGEAVELKLKAAPEKTVIMMVGLQGAGKTTTAAKLAGKWRKTQASAGTGPLLVACDIYRPAAVEQLKINGSRVGADVYEAPAGTKPADIVRQAIAKADSENYNPVIIDTAGRLHIDEDMMAELQEIKRAATVDYTLLTVDAMTGQDAVNVAKDFADQVGIDGVVLTKLDGDARGGAALSIKGVTDVPVYYAGMGEKLSDLEVFHPDRMAGRILGMGDVLSLIEKAEASLDKNLAEKQAEKLLKKHEFDFNDYLDSMEQMKKLGGFSGVLSMLPGTGLKMKQMPEVDEKQFDRISAMIYSMTPAERANPDLLNISRRNRIARGSGMSIAEVNKVVKQFQQMKKMLKNKNLMGGFKKWL